MNAPRTRMKPADRKTQILQCAAFMALSKGYQAMSSIDVSRAAECTTTLVFHHFQNMDGLRRAIMQWAIDNDNAELILQGLTATDVVAINAPEYLKDKARALLNPKP